MTRVLTRIAYSIPNVAERTGLTSDEVWQAIESGELIARRADETTTIVYWRDLDRFTDGRGLPQING